MRYLRGLVTVLTVTMILGVLTVVALLVMRLAERPEIVLPQTITLPDGARATAFNQGEGWYAVVTEADEILIYSRSTGDLVQRVEVVSQP